MKKWKKLLALSAIGVLVMLGGYSMFGNNKEETEKQQKREIEIALSKKIYSEYKDVKKIEFNQWGHSKETGMWGITVDINDSNTISFNFSDLKSIDSLRGSNYNPKTFKLVKRDKKLDSDQVTIDKLKIQYSE